MRVIQVPRVCWLRATAWETMWRRWVLKTHKTPHFTGIHQTVTQLGWRRRRYINGEDWLGHVLPFIFQSPLECYEINPLPFLFSPHTLTNAHEFSHKYRGPARGGKHFSLLPPLTQALPASRKPSTSRSIPSSLKCTPVPPPQRPLESWEDAVKG